MHRRAPIALGTLLACATGCSDWLGFLQQDIKAADRRLIGEAWPYEPDEEMAQREEELKSSQMARREMAWEVVARVIDAVEIAEPRLEDDKGYTPTVPRWHTWYGKDDVRRMFKRLYSDLGRDGRRARMPFAQDALDRIFKWNAQAVTELPSWPEERYLDYLSRFEDELDISGAAGAHRVGYSPGAVMHLFENYAPVRDCTVATETLDPDQETGIEDNFSTCYGEELPLDAAIIKAQWRRAELGAKLPYYDTSADALRRRVAEGGTGSWGDGDGLADPGPDRIYTVRLPNGNSFRLAGLHIMTKELRHWVWITLWWSNDPDTDFGADRPPFFRELGPAWANYKMCVTTFFEEGDADPRGGYDQKAPTLADALEAVYSGRGGPSWCSNPYLEEGPGNARTNCIGCHQQAGSLVRPEELLGNDQRFPENSRAEARKNFPTDYLWTIHEGEQIGRVISDEMEYYDGFESD